MEVPILIAVDPSFTSTGIAVMKGDNVLYSAAIRTNPTRTPTERFDFITKSFFSILEKYPARLLAIETQYIALRSSSVLRVVEVKGVLEGCFLAACYTKGLPPEIVEVSPLEARKHIGIKTRMKRKEGKEEIKRLVLELYPELGKQKQDIYDAVAIGKSGYILYKEKLSTLNKD